MANKAGRVLSCVQPTAELHIGNYFGAIANWVALQESHDCIYGVVDLHAMTMPYSPAVLRHNTERMAIDLLACGIDPTKSILFVQSLVPEHTELCWILSCVSSYGELSRMTQFKDKSKLIKETSSSEFISAGLFTYPVLQAADILIYRAGYVPVGKDQQQHLELSRNIAKRFNRVFGQIFPEPQPLFTETPKIMSLADPSQKMSKSLGAKHYVGLFEEEESIRAKVRTAVTESGDLRARTPGVENLFEILKACGKSDEVRSFAEKYEKRELKYAEMKESVADALVELTTHLRGRREEIAGNPETVRDRIYAMSETARKIAKETLYAVRELVGLPKSTKG
jgi:tryptophanyl-tRNA synthetase